MNVADILSPADLDARLHEALRQTWFVEMAGGIPMPTGGPHYDPYNCPVPYASEEFFAMRLLDAMVSRGWKATIFGQQSSWTVILGLDTYSVTPEGSGQALAEAIARASLAALEKTHSADSERNH